MSPAPGQRGLSAEELFRRHAGFVARFLFRLGVHPDDLDDVVQEVFLVVHAQGGYAPGPAKPTSYLASIALRAASTQRRRRAGQAARGTERDPDEIMSGVLDPVRRLELDESMREVEEGLAQLSPLLRATLLLVEQEGESCSSIAASMDVPVGTVYWRLHQARRAFKRALSAREQANTAALATLRKGVRP